MVDTLKKVRHWVQIKRKIFVPNTTAISEESSRIGRFLKTLDNALDDVIYVLDDKRRRGYPDIYLSPMRRNNKVGKTAAAAPEIMLDFVLDEERSPIPETPTPPPLPLTPVAEILVDQEEEEERSTIPEMEPPATPRPLSPQPSPAVTPPRSASSQFANRKKSSPNQRPSTTPKSTSGRKMVTFSYKFNPVFSDCNQISGNRLKI
ncbi:hypothetical protein Fcan01_18409 [Folsomia candida]|uniref:Uncharacterized protein n=1 Tax=Folsomia candida TaxID=158441 RepID=A0A226DPH9_FOLCA|nr:hypothetical protein Fcan01_18409 [Folsomia candida]